MSPAYTVSRAEPPDVLRGCGRCCPSHAHSLAAGALREDSSWTMLGLDLVRPLDAGWREVIDAVARSRGWPTTRDAARLGALVEALAGAYNDPKRARASARQMGAARLGFSFARDVPKGSAAVRELVALGLLPRSGPLRVLDVGAGLGAMTWGVLGARAAAGGAGPVEATWIDADAEALEIGMDLVRERARRSTAGPELRVTPVHARVTGGLLEGLTGRAGARFDLVLVGHLLSEMDGASDAAPRAAAHGAWLRLLLERHVAPDGSLVVVEPALRDRSRHLHRVRDAVVASGGASVLAPCTHAFPCPALATEGDWCHEDLSVDLPAWLVPVARA